MSKLKKRMALMKKHKDILATIRRREVLAATTSDRWIQVTSMIHVGILEGTLEIIEEQLEIMDHKE